jgi:hypothetical protein
MISQMCAFDKRKRNFRAYPVYEPYDPKETELNRNLSNPPGNTILLMKLNLQWHEVARSFCAAQV